MTTRNLMILMSLIYIIGGLVQDDNLYFVIAHVWMASAVVVSVVLEKKDE